MIRIIIGSDRVGYELKTWLIRNLANQGYELVDLGPFEAKSVHYPVIAMDVARNVVKSENSFGILVCSTGIGMCIAANKVRGIRAANCDSLYLAEQSRAHNDANVLCLGSSVTSAADALGIVERFIAAPFEGGKHSIRVQMLRDCST
jgi:ribose 5-phosphate isomerase B